MTPDQALAFVERHGIVLESTRRGSIPSLADAVAGEQLGGNWWSHASGKQIFVQAALASTVQGDRVVSVRHYLDVFTLLQQIGAIPAPG